MKKTFNVITLMAVISCVTPVSGYATTADCVAPNGSYNTDEAVEVRINLDSFDNLYDFYGNQGAWSVDTRIGVVLQAMEQWNTSANGRIFTYGGDTNETSATCSFAVVVASDDGGTLGLANPSGSPCAGDTFTITLQSKNSSGIINRFIAGDPYNVTENGSFNNIYLTTHQYRDTVAVLTHEFGHAAGLGHPDPADASVVMNNNTVRELHQLDQECAELYYDGAAMRSLALYQEEASSGSLSLAYLLGSNVLHGSPGVSAGGATSGPDRFRGVVGTHTGLHAYRYSSGLRQLTTKVPAISPTRAHRRELGAAYRDVVFASDRTSHLYGDRDSEYFSVDAFYSNDGFDSNHTATKLYECTVPQGGLLGSCGNYKYVRTARPVAVAYDERSARSIAVWTHLDRGDDAVNNDVRVAWGGYNGTVLAPSLSLGVKSDVAPAVACKQSQANGYDCYVAYTDINDPKQSVRLKRMWSGSAGSTYYDNIVVASGYYTIDSAGWVRSSSNLGLFYHDSKWWLAVRLALATGGGEVRFYTSTSGATGTWTLEDSSLLSVTGASAIGDWMISNRVFVTP